MQARTILGALVIVILGLLVWRLIANHVDFKKPDAVATAFVKALKSENLDKAGKYWVPTEAAARTEAAKGVLQKMGSASYADYVDKIPAAPVFVASHSPNSPANEQTLKAEDYSLDLRQIDGKWYVCKAPLW